MAGKVREIRLADCLLASSTEILIILPHSFFFLLSDKWKSLRLDAIFQIFFQFLGGHPPDPPLLILLPHIWFPTLSTWFFGAPVVLGRQERE